MKRWKVIITPDALRDLEDIYYYVRFTLLEPGTAKRLLSRIRKELRSLDYLPERYGAMQDETWQEHGLRKLMIGNYIAVYTAIAESQSVFVLRIVYGGRDIDQILEDLKDLP